MPTYVSSISIAAPRESVWRVLSDVVAWPAWLPTVTKVVPLDGTSLRLGSRFVVHQPKLRPAIWTVSEVEAPARFVWVARLPGVRMVAEHTITEDAAAGSMAELRFSFAGLLGDIVGRLFRRVTESYIAQEASSLKYKVEAAGKVP
ncbi:MAG: SRPBCC family protein [Acidobacteriaceae bacterium]|nr:SRPBCC family protein [Acidobacteriaceae bacterium]